MVVVTGSTSVGRTDQRAAFPRGAAAGDALAVLPPDWADGDPAPLLLPGA
ncbi:hypothetical protein [Streptomyces tanashiensis]|nr:hypothetical protein [Streptomyces tanashiensis]GGY17684.1 hypothetical protein GCM10010299_23770 [Streptomyces tanashiensis]